MVDSPHLKKKNPDKKNGSKVSRKVTEVCEKQLFLKKLVAELRLRQEHLHCCHKQYSAFKKAREEAMTNPDIVTMQIDWSVNPKMRQTREEKSAYYDENQISLHTILVWSADGNNSISAMSDYTDHKAPAVFATINPVKEMVESGKKKINIVSDSPTSQCRNRKLFYLLQQFSLKYQITLHWIYLEAGHGKGIPDGIGAVVKSVIQDILAFNPDDPIYTVDQLLQKDFSDHLPNVSIVVYSEHHVEEVEQSIPDVKPIAGTMKIHDVLAKPSSKPILVKDTSDQQARSVCVTINKKSKIIVAQTAEGSDDDDKHDGDDDDDDGKDDDDEGDVLTATKKIKVKLRVR